MSPKFPNLQFFGLITISNELHDPNVKVRMLVYALFLENTGCSDRCSKLQSIVSMTKQNNYENDK